uniref:Uncharacterized protein n=1 Tax=Cucumis melo TaxID=3656 RepID=A0A9I9CFX0_CUCME
MRCLEYVQDKQVRKNCSSGSKRKRGSEHYETIEVIRSAMEFGNDQLRQLQIGQKRSVKQRSNCVLKL